MPGLQIRVREEFHQRMGTKRDLALQHLSRQELGLELQVVHTQLVELKQAVCSFRVSA